MSPAIYSSEPWLALERQVYPFQTSSLSLHLCWPGLQPKHNTGAIISNLGITVTCLFASDRIQHKSSHIEAKYQPAWNVSYNGETKCIRRKAAPPHNPSDSLLRLLLTHAPLSERQWENGPISDGRLPRSTGLLTGRLLGLGQNGVYKVNLRCAGWEPRGPLYKSG